MRRTFPLRHPVQRPGQYRLSGAHPLHAAGLYRVLPSGSKPTLVFLTLALAGTLFILTYLDRIRSRILPTASIRLDQTFATRIVARALSAGGSGKRKGAAAVKRHLKKLARERYALKNLRRGRPVL